MTDFEILITNLTIIGIIVPLLIELINQSKK